MRFRYTFNKLEWIYREMFIFVKTSRKLLSLMLYSVLFLHPHCDFKDGNCSLTKGCYERLVFIPLRSKNWGENRGEAKGINLEIQL